MHLTLFHRLAVDTPLSTIEFCLDAHEYIHGNPDSLYWGNHEHIEPNGDPEDEWTW